MSKYPYETEKAIQRILADNDVEYYLEVTQDILDKMYSLGWRPPMVCDEE